MDSRPHDNEAVNTEEGLARPAVNTGTAHVDSRAVGGEAAATGASMELQEASGSESRAEADDAGGLAEGARKSAAAAEAEAAGVWVTDNLLPQHVLHLRASGLDDVTIMKAQLRSVTEAEEARSILRWMPSMKPPNVPAIAFPYPGNETYVRLRPDTPRLHKDGHEVKYESPVEVSGDIYAPIAVNPKIDDRATELYLVEGEKKCLAANLAGLAAVGAPGVTCFHDPAARKASHKEGKDEWKLQPRLDRLVRRAVRTDPKRDVTIAFDSDIDTNQNVQWSAAVLIQMLRTAGAKPHITFIDCFENDEKLGVDDLYVELGHDAVALRTKLDVARRPCAPDQLLHWMIARWPSWEFGQQRIELRRAVWIVKRTSTRDELNRWLNDIRAALHVRKDELKPMLQELKDNEAIAEQQLLDAGDWMHAPGYLVFGEGRNVGVWTVSPTGLGDQIAPQPINVVEILTDEHDRMYETLRFRCGDREITRTVPRGTIAGRDLQLLADYGAPVVAATCSDMQRFLQLQEQHNFDTIPKLPAYTEFGWTRDLQAFVLGRNVIGASGRSLVDADPAFLEALQPGGDERVHRELMVEARRASIFGEIGEASGAAAPLIRLLRLRSLLLSTWGKSTGGKSASQALSVSHFGRPEGMKLTGNSTPTALEGALKRSRDLPLWFDDTQQTSSRELLETIAYSVGSGTGKGRGMPTGELRPLANWNSLAFVSGEKPLLKLGVAQGARNRTLEFRFQPFEDAGFPSHLHRELMTHYGHTGPVLVRTLLERVIRPGKRETLRSLYSAISSRIAGARSERVDQIALLALGTLISRVFIFGEDERDAAEAAVLFGKKLHEMSHAAADAGVDRIAAGYEAIWAWITEHHAEFVEEGRRFGVQVHPEGDQYKNKLVYAVMRKPLLECAQRGGFDLDEVLHGLVERKKLIEGESDGKGGRRMQLRTKELKGARAYWIVLDDAGD